MLAERLRRVPVRSRRGPLSRGRAGPGRRRGGGGAPRARQGRSPSSRTTRRARPRRWRRSCGPSGSPPTPAEVETSALTTAALLAERGVRRRVRGRRRRASGARSPRPGSRVLEGDPGTRRRGGRGVRPRGRLRRSSAGPRCSSQAASPSSPRTPTPRSRRATVSGGRARGRSLAAVETTTGVRAEVVGKPNAPILRAALARAGGGRPLVIGDRLDTDIAGAVTMGWAVVPRAHGHLDAASDIAAFGFAPTYVWRRPLRSSPTPTDRRRARSGRGVCSR